MIIEKQIDCRLHIHEEDGSGIIYKNDLEADICGLLIACEVLKHAQETYTINRDGLPKGDKRKKGLTTDISAMAKAEQLIGNLAFNLIQSYESFKKKAQVFDGAAAAYEKMQHENPEPISDLKGNTEE